MPYALFLIGLKRLAVMLAIGALAMRMLLPSGFMLSAAPGAIPTLVICTGQGAVSMSMADMPGMEMPTQAQDRGDAHHDEGDKHPCGFATASAAVDLASTVHPAATMLGVAADWTPFHRTLRPGLGLAAPPPPKTGPPILF